MLLALALLTVAVQDTNYAARVEIRRTAHGVPHILAEDFGALGYGLAWAQLEDHGSRVVLNLVRARGELARHFGPDSADSDFRHRESHAFAVETYSRLSQDLRRIQEGWAAAVNRWVATHPASLARFELPLFTPHDVAALWVDEQVAPAIRRFQRAEARRDTATGASDRDNIGSNAWAFGPGRTTSRNAILLRNPHLGWRNDWYSTYYEAHITVPDVLNFYGDFRVGFPFYFNGGFNEFLGWATTNNNPDLEEVYAIAIDPANPAQLRFDGGAIPLQRKVLAIEVRADTGMETAFQTVWRTSLGPVIGRRGDTVFVLKSPGWREYRKAEQFLAMMRARALDQWKQAMAMRAHTESNLTYADRSGNIYYIWNAALPRRPGPSGHDTLAIPAAGTDDIWTELYALDSLPQLLNPRSGYLHNENDPFHFTNLESPIDSARFPAPDFPAPALRFRSQLAALLIAGRPRVSLDDVVAMKHSYRMLAAERLVDELIAAVESGDSSAATLEALDVLKRWDRSSAPASRGTVLFVDWYDAYWRGSGESTPERDANAFAQPWTPRDPVHTPAGLGDPARAARVFAEVAAVTKSTYGRMDPAWGDLVRVRRGSVDVPVGGCPGAYGCFRVLAIQPIGDGRYEDAGGDGWVLVVEFGKSGPLARSVLAYGESSNPPSPWFSDQAAMFARGELKRVAFSERDIQAGLVRKYRPE